MFLYDKKDTAFMDIIRCDEPNYLIWKWHPARTVSGKNKRENSIRWGSSLRVREGSVAVFVYSQPDGYIHDFIEGPYDCRLDTLNLPVLTSIRGLLYGGDTPFQAEVYFINLAQLIQVKFGVPFFDVFDPRFLDFGVPTAVRGTMSFKITDYKEFIKLHRLESFNLQDFQTQIRDIVIKTIKNAVSNAPTEYGIPVIQIERKISQVNDLVETDVKTRLGKDFGVTVTGVDISTIELDKSSEGYQRLISVTQDVSAATIQAQTDVNIKKMQDVQRIEAEHMESMLKVQREEAQFAQRLQTQSDHLTAHQINQQAAVGIAGAEAFGQMGAGGATSMGTGMNPAGMMASMMMGSAVGQNMAHLMKGMMSGMTQPIGTTPPPIPATDSEYYVAVDGKPTGPYNLVSLKQMVAEGTLSKESLLWKSGMTNWVKSYEIQELYFIFSSAPPTISEIPPIPL